ncbi:hypothetical protein QTH97_32375 [Variovorax sp. J22R24]|uniref:hypothetical protein n=1 Tax=Variovorax gracilis TaxID=3053502 RepID=UPI002575E17F|nr:hypothetical protein [Variovorax sp. J22R24]MDM0109655.1 hypothetical protein [Variovorax sp. J22R24]
MEFERRVTDARLRRAVERKARDDGVDVDRHGVQTVDRLRRWCECEVCRHAGSLVPIKDRDAV